MAEQKNFPASAKRLREARKKGDIAKSSTLSGSLGLSAFILCTFLQQESIGNLSSFMEKSLLLDADFHSKHVLVSGTDALGLFLSLLSPFFLLICLAQIAAEIAQVGLVFSFEALKPKFEKFNLLQGFARLLGVQGQDSTNTLLRALVTHALQLVVLGSMFLGVLACCSGLVRTRDYQSTTDLLEVLGLALGILFMCSFVVLFILGLFELCFQRMHRAKRLRMTTEEFRREHRETQGNPETRGMRKQLHQEILLHGLVQQVRKAAVVVRGRRG